MPDTQDCPKAPGKNLPSILTDLTNQNPQAPKISTTHRHPLYLPPRKALLQPTGDTPPNRPGTHHKHHSPAGVHPKVPGIHPKVPGTLNPQVPGTLQHQAPCNVVRQLTGDTPPSRCLSTAGWTPRMWFNEPARPIQAAHSRAPLQGEKSLNPPFKRGDWHLVEPAGDTPQNLAGHTTESAAFEGGWHLRGWFEAMVSVITIGLTSPIFYEMAVKSGSAVRRFL